MANFRDRTGERHGRLTVVCEAPVRTKSQRVRWYCKCDCGGEAVVTGTDLRPDRTQSCGCLQRERTATKNFERVKHGHTRIGDGGRRDVSPEYYSWKGMIQRCSNPNAPNYHLYGGRGITVCSRWQGGNGFSNFFADMGARPVGLTLDRINVDGNYEPINCRWATKSEQAQNRRSSPELNALREESLRRGREKMWSDPEIRSRIIESRKKTRHASA